MRMRRPADDHQVSIDQNRRVSLGHRDNADVEDRTEPGSDGIGNQVRVAIHGLIDNHGPHGCHLLILLVFTFILPRPGDSVSSPTKRPLVAGLHRGEVADTALLGGLVTVHERTFH